MKLGDVIESAIWLNGNETREQRLRFETDVRNAVHTVCEGEGWLHTPVTFVEKHPFDDFVPPVPDHIQGQRVRLLVAQAEVVGKKPESKPDSFIANLDPKDLKRLRTITRVAAANNEGVLLNDSQCDKIIEACGPHAALDALRGHRLH